MRKGADQHSTPHKELTLCCDHGRKDILIFKKSYRLPKRYSCAGWPGEFFEESFDLSGK
jgi:hypothetical protein